MDHPARLKLILAGLLFLTFLVYLPGIVSALSGDDFVHVFKNQAGLRNAWEHFLRADNREFRPLVRLSLELDHAVWAKDYRGYHLTNLLLHLAAVTFLFYWLRTALTPFGAAWPRNALPLLCTSLFALHPIHSYSVNAVMGRTDLLCCVGVLAALLFLEKGQRGAALTAMGVALLSKETAVALPVFILLVRLLAEDRRDWRKTLATLSPLVLLDLVYIVFRFCLMPPAARDVAVYLQFSPTGIIRNLVFFLGALVVPVSGYRSRELMEAMPILVGITALLACGIMMWLWRRGHLGKEVWIGASWTLVFLLPVLLLFQRRYLYLPSAGYSLALGFLLLRLRSIRFRRVLTTLVVGAYAGLSLAGSLEWRTAASDVGRFLACATEVVAKEPNANWFAANVPYGRGEAHLFTHESLRYALGLQLGRLPRLAVLTRIQYGETPPETSVSPQGWVTTRITPGPDSFFMLDAPEFLPRGGRYLPVGTSTQKAGFDIEVTGNDKAGRVARIDLRPGDGTSGRLLVFTYRNNPSCEAWELP